MHKEETQFNPHKNCTMTLFKYRLRQALFYALIVIVFILFVSENSLFKASVPIKLIFGTFYTVVLVGITIYEHKKGKSRFMPKRYYQQKDALPRLRQMLDEKKYALGTTLEKREVYFKRKNFFQWEKAELRMVDSFIEALLPGEFDDYQSELLANDLYSSGKKKPVDMRAYRICPLPDVEKSLDKFFTNLFCNSNSFLYLSQQKFITASYQERLREWPFDALATSFDPTQVDERC